MEKFFVEKDVSKQRFERHSAHPKTKKCNLIVSEGEPGSPTTKPSEVCSEWVDMVRILLAKKNLRINSRTIFGHSRSPKIKYYHCVLLCRTYGTL